MSCSGFPVLRGRLLGPAASASQAHHQ
jgi:hypothetical protein